MEVLMRRSWIALATLTLAFIVGPAGPAPAADDEPNLELAYPLVTRRPVIERELELRIDHTSRRAGRETRVVPAIELPLLPRWQLAVSAPFLFADPHEGPATAGPGDVEIENKVLLLAPLLEITTVTLTHDEEEEDGPKLRGRTQLRAAGRDGLGVLTLLPRRPLLGDDLSLDLVVGGLRDDLLPDELVLPPVRTVLDDLLRRGVTDPRQGLEILRGGAVDVQRALLHLGGPGRRLLGGLGPGVPSRARRGDEGEGDEHRDQSLHGVHLAG
jgi:hypothetical protein